MKTDLPVPERTLPPASADRIRSAIMSAEPERDGRANRWLLALAAAAVVIALLATAALLWPGASRTQVVATPTPESSATVAGPTEAPTGMPSPTPAPSRTEPLEPGPNQEPFDTDRGEPTTKTVQGAVKECTGDKEIEKVLYARRVTDGKRPMDVTIIRQTNGEEWLCAPALMYVPLDVYNAENGPNWSFPVITDAGRGYGLQKGGATTEWTFRALSSVQRVQVRAVVNGEPQRWFEGEVHDGFAFVPIYTKGDFRSTETRGVDGVTYEQRAFDVDGREVPVRVMELPR